MAQIDIVYRGRAKSESRLSYESSCFMISKGTAENVLT